MNKAEFYQWFVECVQSRWPSFEVSEVVLEDGFLAFGKHPQQRLTEAVRRHKISDYPAVPNTRKLLEILAKLRPANFYKPAAAPDGCMTGGQFWETVRTSFSKEKRIELILQAAKFHPHPQQYDREAYGWAVEQKLIPG